MEEASLKKLLKSKRNLQLSSIANQEEQDYYTAHFHLRQISKNQFVKLRWLTFLKLRFKEEESSFSCWLFLQQFLDKVERDTLFTFKDRNEMYFTLNDTFLNKNSSLFVEIEDKSLLKAIRKLVIRLRANPTSFHLKIPRLLLTLRLQVEERLKNCLKSFQEMSKGNNALSEKFSKMETNSVMKKQMKVKISLNIISSTKPVLFNKIGDKEKWQESLCWIEKQSLFVRKTKKRENSGEAEHIFDLSKFSVHHTSTEVLRKEKDKDIWIVISNYFRTIFF